MEFIHIDIYIYLCIASVILIVYIPYQCYVYTTLMAILLGSFLLIIVHVVLEKMWKKNSGKEVQVNGFVEKYRLCYGITCIYRIYPTESKLWFCEISV